MRPGSFCGTLVAPRHCAEHHAELHGSAERVDLQPGDGLVFDPPELDFVLGPLVGLQCVGQLLVFLVLPRLSFAVDLSQAVFLVGLLLDVTFELVLPYQKPLDDWVHAVVVQETLCLFDGCRFTRTILVGS